MTTDLVAAVHRALERVRDPEILRPITELGMVRGVEAGPGGAVRVGIALTIAGCPAARRIEADVTEAVQSTPGVTEAVIEIEVMSPAERQTFIERVRGARTARPQQFGPDSLTRVLAITSGKGGVGKSSITANLAAEFAKRGLSVGVIDADVFGFSIPALMGLSVNGRTESPTRIDDLMLPPVAHGVKVISIGMFLGDADARQTAVSWRGPMLHRTIEQFLRDVWFGDLDVLLLDLPPGTGDIAISVGQLLPQAAVVVVTTPQPAAADVAIRSGLVARQTGQRVVGVIENMAGLAQPDGTVLDIFGTGGGASVAEALSDEEHGTVPLLGSVPLSPAFRECGDAGIPAVLEAPGDSASMSLAAIAEALVVRPTGLKGRSLPIAPATSPRRQN